MKTVVCDKCGAPINLDPWINQKFPVYTIYKIPNGPTLDSKPIVVDLCPNCQKAFETWLENPLKVGVR